MNNTTNNIKKQWVSQINNLLFIATANQRFWKKKDKDISLKINNVTISQDRCPSEINSALCLTPKNKQDRSGQFEKSYREWKWCRDILHGRNLTDDELRRGLRQVANKIRVFTVERENGCQPFESNTKGTARYDRKIAWQAMDYIKNHCDGNWDIYFFTTTLSTKKWKDRAFNWEHYDETHIKAPLEHLRKHLGCEYIRALESFGNGNPHAHILLFFPKGTFSEYQGMKNKDEIKFGRLYEHLKENVASPIFKLEVAEGDNTKFYLTKYLTKYANSDVLSLAEKKGRFTKSERKLIQELVYVKAFRLHTVEKCKDRSLAGLKAEQERRQASFQEEKVRKEKMQKAVVSAEGEKETATKWRSLLTSLCINSPLHCDVVMKSMQIEKFKKEFNRYPKKNDVLTKDEEKRFNSGCNSFGCGGCFYSELVKFVLGDMSSKLNLRFYFSRQKNLYSDFTDGYDLNNDEDFMKCIADMTTLYFNKCLLGYNTLNEVVEGKEDVAPYVLDYETREIIKEKDGRANLEIKSDLLEYIQKRT